MYQIKLTGPLSNMDEALNGLLMAGYDCIARQRSILAFGKCPLSAGRAVEHLGWKQHAASPSSPLELVA